MKFLLALVLIMLTSTSCAVTVGEERPGEGRPSEGKGPPPWAPAHGYREKAAHHYYYYPSSSVYFDVERRVYFYRSGGEWHVSPILPPTIVIEPTHYAEMDLETDEPYRHYNEHREKYKDHPGKGGKHKDEGEDNDDKGRGRGRGREKD